MFGWEFPPNISGGLGTACYGLTKSLSSIPGVDITFIIPKVHGNEPSQNIALHGANQVDLIKSKIHTERLKFPAQCYSVESNLVPYVDPVVYEKHQISSVEHTGTSVTKEQTGKVQFTGRYGPDLFAEIHNFSVVGEYLAQHSGHDLIHAHDWLTFPSGIAAKKISGKPLVVHVHATEFDRSGERVNPNVYKIEKEGMEQADRVVCVSNRTREIVIKKYRIPPYKVLTVHNGVEFASNGQTVLPLQYKEKTVTFLGRITYQKGPEYFVEVAEMILRRMNNVRFVMAGSGDLYHKMITKVARAQIANHFFFPGFLKGDDVYRMLKNSDVFVMPSISEPFGIVPLEAMRAGVPTIISKQSGVSEVIKHAIKVDFWDVHSMADAIHGILSYPSLFRMMQKKGNDEATTIRWDDAASKLKTIYQDVILSA